MIATAYLLAQRYRSGTKESVRDVDLSDIIRLTSSEIYEEMLFEVETSKEVASRRNISGLGGSYSRRLPPFRKYDKKSMFIAHLATDTPTHRLAGPLLHEAYRLLSRYITTTRYAPDHGYPSGFRPGGNYLARYAEPMEGWISGIDINGDPPLYL